MYVMCPVWVGVQKGTGREIGGAHLVYVCWALVVDVAMMGGGQLMWLGIGIHVVVVIGAAWACQLVWRWAVGSRQLSSVTWR